MFDIAVAGGGVLGLWVAKLAADAGLSVVVLEARSCGAGASATPLGALLPHLPGVASARKDFQFDALAALPALIRDLEADTGIATGYAQCGRIMPVRREGFRDRAARAAAASADVWRRGGAEFRVTLEDAAPGDGWIDPEIARFGIVRDTLSAKVRPADYVSALRSAVAKRAEILENFSVAGFDAVRGVVCNRNSSQEVHAGRLVLAAGYQTFDLLQQMTGQTFGAGVKGQAAIFKVPVPAGLPIIYDDGVYLVAHAPDTIAAGSTTEVEWTEAGVPDPGAGAAFVEKARTLSPRLRDVPVSAWWAGVRPRCAAKDPMIGPVDSGGHLFVATGGYKITLGIAHRLAQALVEELTGAERTVALPGSFAADYHQNAGRARPCPGQA